MLDTRRGGSIDPRLGSQARTRVTNLPESTGTVAPLPPAPACFYALRALEEPDIFCWKHDVMAVLFAGKDFGTFCTVDRFILTRFCRGSLSKNTDPVCNFSLSPLVRGETIECYSFFVRLAIWQKEYS